MIFGTGATWWSGRIRNQDCRSPTEAPVQPNEQLTDAEGDGVSRDDDGLVSTFGVSAVVDLKLISGETVKLRMSWLVPEVSQVVAAFTLMVVPLMPVWTVREHCRVVRMLSTTTQRTLRPLTLD